jgi:hypothetical protein
METTCPICSAVFPSETPLAVIQRHVNRCLDGTPEPPRLIGEVLTPIPSGRTPGGGGGQPMPSFTGHQPDQYSPQQAEEATAAPSSSNPQHGSLWSNPGSPDQSSPAEPSAPRLPPSSSGGSVERKLDTTTDNQTQPSDHSNTTSTSTNSMAEQLVILQSLFPGLPRAYGEQLLEATAGDVESAVGLLEDMLAAEREEQRLQLERQRSQDESFEGNGSIAASSSNSRPSPSHAASPATVALSSSSRGTVAVAPERPVQPPRLPAVWIPPVDVELIIYDLKPDGMSRHFGFGIYHSAVILAGKEIGFGGSPEPEMAQRTGIFFCRPGQAADVIKKRYTIGLCNRTPEDVFATLKAWGQMDWKIGDYHLLSRNCNHFTDFLLRFLAEEAICPELDDLVMRHGLKPPRRRPPELQDPLKGPIVSDDAKPSSTKTASSNGVPSAVGGSKVRSGPNPPPSPGSASLPAEEATPPQRTQSVAGRGLLQVQELYLSLGATIGDSSGKKKFEKEIKALIEDLSEKWKLPDWVNRAARVGNTLVPDFVYKKVVASEQKETPNAENTSTKVQPPVATVAAPAPLQVGGSSPASSSISVSPDPTPRSTPNAENGAAGSNSSGSSLSPSAQEKTKRLQIVQAIFPDVPKSTLHQVLQRSGWNVDRAIDALLGVG